jgi:predicted AlkP superfamily pyrophosphatase or phosphodiesterase
MSTDNVQLDLRSVTATVCSALGAAPPEICDAPPFPAVADTRVERVLIFAPDAIGTHLVTKYRDEFAPVLKHAPVQVPLRSIMPTKTPVCFATMFTGGLPEAHGIRKYEKPVLRCDTLFDALARAGRRAAIVATADNTIDLIYGEVNADRFSEPYDDEVLTRTLEVLQRDEHDLVVAYQQEYDDQLHRTAPESPECLAAMRRHIAAFDRLVRAAKQAWAGRPSLFFFTPDHGGHIDPETGRGTHGTDLPEDLEVTHFLGWSGV